MFYIQPVSYLCNSVAIVSIIFGVMDAAKAQNNLPKINQSVLNGLYSPTAAERFFEEGRRNIKRETNNLTNPKRYNNENILKNNIIDSKIIEERGRGKIKPMDKFIEDSLQKN